ncbi:NADP-dependent oxidoreductase domain-containing protein [Pavlovales sp. CCMP2436]|nr:NADP-dependent oxidoreductase domain-containing protein [Pavlovales sp. CCMP2436]
MSSSRAKSGSDTKSPTSMPPPNDIAPNDIASRSSPAAAEQAERTANATADISDPTNTAAVTCSTEVAAILSSETVANPATSDDELSAADSDQPSDVAGEPHVGVAASAATNAAAELHPSRGRHAQLPCLEPRQLEQSGERELSADFDRWAQFAPLERGCVAVDTAPTYKNEAAVGRALALWPAAFVPFVIAKVPKAVTDPAQVRPTLLKSLGLLGVQCADLLLLHWPSNVVEAGTLTSVWGAMQALVAEGLARGVGVCNFTIGALELLPSPPLLVQVERHPLLPQWELAHYCAARGIVLQAHMPLGGKIGASITRAGAAHAGGNGALAFTIGTEHMHLLDGMSAPPAGGTKRFLSAARVAFMRKPGAAYSW